MGLIINQLWQILHSVCKEEGREITRCRVSHIWDVRCFLMHLTLITAREMCLLLELPFNN